jgi:membrane protein implicated in regulation of membrane protease activity
MVDVANGSDPAFLLFAACAGFSALFMAVAAVNGAIHGHGVHLHSAHPGQMDVSLHAAHGGHVPHAAPSGNALHVDPAGHVGHVGHAGTTQHNAAHGHSGHSGHAHLGKPVHHASASHVADAARAGGAHAAQAHPYDSHSAHAADRATNNGHFSAATGYARLDASTRLQGYWHGLTSLALRSLNLYAILTFLFFFGGVGLLLEPSMQGRKPLLFTIATIVGLVAALIFTSILHRLFDDASGVVTHENSRLRGREAKVIHRIRDGGIGEIVYVPRGGVPQNYPARSVDGKAIAVGQQVIVVDFKRGVALVELLDLALDLVGDDDDTES